MLWSNKKVNGDLGGHWLKSHTNWPAGENFIPNRCSCMTSGKTVSAALACCHHPEMMSLCCRALCFRGRNVMIWVQIYYRVLTLNQSIAPWWPLDDISSRWQHHNWGSTSDFTGSSVMSLPVSQKVVERPGPAIEEDRATLFYRAVLKLDNRLDPVFPGKLWRFIFVSFPFP